MIARLLGVLVLAAGVCVAVNPVGAATPRSVIGTAGNSLATISVNAHNIGTGTQATGTFTSTGNLLPGIPSPIGDLGAFRFSGPVTCLDIVGNRAGLIYPITTASGPVAGKATGLAIYVTLVDNGPDKPPQLGFAGPAPIRNLHVCPPTVAFLTATFGRVTITD